MEELVDRCPHCRGAVRAAAPWCTQCWADLRPAPAPGPVPAPVAPERHAASTPAVDPLTAPAAALGLVSRPATEPSWPCATCGGTNPLTSEACTACGAPFLAGLRQSEPPLLALPGVGDLTRMSRARRLGLAAVVVLAVCLLTALLSLAVG